MCVKGAIHSIDVPLPVVVTVTHDVNGVIVVIVVTVDLFLCCYTFCSSSLRSSLHSSPFFLPSDFHSIISSTISFSPGGISSFTCRNYVLSAGLTILLIKTVYLRCISIESNLQGFSRLGLVRPLFAL